ncbi:chromosome condensation complex Condensin, subunit G [Ascochyta rabiei]|uniref:chromosome condensation complex Condensin, subunit G n=1 Tax=Didymella rabiei TaxID=5454 RepID=UPI0018FF3938|nr:chromosome condensation complex Condensin, subunit G [Ascochyta rabiei]UPX19829.1 chromosome condensation complex Condensin, subunit G [Ascochyta rabiei]
MPGRTATRSSRSTRQSAVAIPDEGPATALRTHVVHIFSDAQKTTATQRKLVVNLRKIQEACCFEPLATAKQANRALEEELEDFDGDDFNHELMRNVLRIMNVKKSEPVGDRVIRFLCAFLRYATERDQDQSDSPSSRLTNQVLRIILRLATSKDKTIRFRATQTVAHMLNSLEQIDDDVYALIRAALFKRLRDKEPSVRVQAVLGLGRMTGDDEENQNDDNDDSDDDDDNDGTGTIRQKLVNIMIHDPDAQVRRTILANLPILPPAMRDQWERARDVDPATRRVLYAKLLPTLGDFRHLSLVQREKLIRWGLKDRDDAVRKAAARLFRERWIEDCASKRDTRPEEERLPGTLVPPSREALCELLERIDVVHAGDDDDGMAHEAMKEFWAGRPDYREDIEFDTDFWLNLDPSAAFIVRSLNDYCQDTDDNQVRDMLEMKLPTVKEFAFILQKALNSVTDSITKAATMAEDDSEADYLDELIEDGCFIAKQLLHVCLTLDYSDEMGRRQMYNIMRDAIAKPGLPEDCTKLAIEVLRIVCGVRGESDFCAVVMEAIADVRDTLLDPEYSAAEAGDDPESFHSAQSEASSPPPMERRPKSGKELSLEEEEEKRNRETLVYSKCLHIVQCTLQNVTADLESDTNLTNMLNTLIIPAVQSRELIIRERGILCLGTAALLSKDLAANNLDLFFHCFVKGHDGLKEVTLQVLADVIITHPQLLAPPVPGPDTTEQSEVPDINPRLKPLVKVLLKGLASENGVIGSIACEAAQKLVLHNILPPEATAEIVKAFTLLYFDPDGITNPAVRQALSYFLPVFCHSKVKNAQLMASIAVPIVSKLLVIRDEIEEEEDAEMVGWPVITAHLADWTDGRKVVGQTELGLDGKMSSKAESELPHVALAIDILERALTSTCSKDERKPLLSLLTKLYISPSAPKRTEESNDDELLETLQALVSEAVEDKIGTDATQRNALVKLETTLAKRIGEAANATVVQDDREDTVTPETAAGRGAPAEEPRSSVAPSVDGSEMDVDDDDDTMLAGMQGEGTRMPLEASDSDDDDDDDDDDDESTPRPARTKTEKTEADIMDELLASDEEMDM